MVNLLAGRGSTLFRALLLILLLSVGMPLHAYRFAVRSYSNADGLPQSQVGVIFQDSLGYIWMGTYSGVARFNGNEFLTFTTHEGLAGNYVYAIAEDDAHNIVVGTDHGLSIIDKNLTVQNPPPSLASIPILAVMSLPTQRLLILSTDGYHLWDGKTLQLVLSLPSSGPSPHLFQDDTGIYLPTSQGIYLYHGDKDMPQLIYRSNDRIIAIARYKGDLYFGSRKGLFQMTAGTATRVLDCGIVRALLVVKGSLWVGSEHGLYHNFGRGWYRIGQGQGLSDSAILALEVDTEETLWIGTNEGVNKLAYRFIKCFFKEDGLPSNSVWSLYHDPQWGVLAGGRGGISRKTDDHFSPLKLPGFSLNSGYVRSMLRDRDGTFWIGTFRSGLYRYRKGRVKAFSRVAGANLRNVFSIVQDGKGRIWMGTSKGVLRVDDGRFRRFHGDKGVPDHTVWQVVLSPHGEIYIATDKGIAQWNGSGFSVPRFADPLKGKTVRNITFNRRGEMWIGTNGQGIFIWNGKEMQHLARDNGFVDDFIWGVVFEKPDTAWIGTNRGIVRYHDGQSILFNKSDGLSGDEMALNTILKDGDGRLWLGVLPGLVQVDPTLYDGNTIPPRVHISTVRVGGRVEVMPKEVIVQPGEREVIFQMDGLSFQDESAVLFQHRLHNYDHWSPPERVRSVRYTNLPPGDYMFQVKACNNMNIWSKKIAEIRVTVKPAWFQRLGVRLAGILLLVILGYLYLQMRLSAGKKARKHLEQIVRERTEELYKASITDSLLDVYNRRYVDNSIATRLEESQRHEDDICFALLDLDGFKQVNDRHGHQVGDKVLKAVAARLKGLIRSTDILARFGGDEFILVFFRTSAEKIDGRLNTIVTELGVGGEDLPRITCSLGVSYHHYTRYSTVTYDQLLQAADRALYEAKAAGKNRFVKREI